MLHQAGRLEGGFHGRTKSGSKTKGARCIKLADDFVQTRNSRGQAGGTARRSCFARRSFEWEPRSPRPKWTRGATGRGVRLCGRNAHASCSLAGVHKRSDPCRVPIAYDTLSAFEFSIRTRVRCRAWDVLLSAETFSSSQST